MDEYDAHKMREVRDRVLSQQPELLGRLTELRSRVIECALTDHGLLKSKTIATEAMEIFLVARNQVEFFDGAINTIIHISAKYPDFNLTYILLHKNERYINSYYRKRLNYANNTLKHLEYVFIKK